MRISIYQCSIIVLCCLFGSCAERYELSSRAMAFMTYHPGETFKLRVNGKDTLTYTVTQRKITKEIGYASSSLGSIKYYYEKGSTVFTNDNRESHMNIQSEEDIAPETVSFGINEKEGHNLVGRGFNLIDFNDGYSWTIDSKTYDGLLELVETRSSSGINEIFRIMFSKDLGLIYYVDSVFVADTLYSVTTLEYIP